MNFDKVKQFLYDQRNSDILDDSRVLYKEIVLVEKDKDASSFYYPAQLQLLYGIAYRYHKSKGLQSFLNSSLPFVIDSNISFSDFCVELEQYKNIPCSSDIVPGDNLYRRIMRGTNRSLHKLLSEGWDFVEKEKIEGTKKNKLDKKIYLSIDNKDLHSFASLLLDKCDNKEIQYCFKINANDQYRRADNVVIYTSDKDFLDYVSIIDSIKEECPYMDFGEAHLLTYPYREYMGVAPIEKENTTYSYSSLLCEEICRLRSEEEISFDHFFENVKSTMNECLSDTICFCEETRMLEESMKKSHIENVHAK